MSNNLWMSSVSLLTLLALSGCVQSQPSEAPIAGSTVGTGRPENQVKVAPSASATVGQENSPNQKRVVTPPTPVANHTVVSNAATVAVNAFTTSLYNQLRPQPGNLFLSPYSISSALAMTYAGAKNQTKQQMAKVLRLNGDEQTLHKGFGDLERSLTTTNLGALYIANAAWVPKTVLLTAEYAELLHETYQAAVKTVDFNTPELATKRINDWVAEKTQQHLETLLQPGDLNQQTQLVLTNAVYFKGQWQFPFRQENTMDSVFVKLDGSKIKVPTMYQKEPFGYLENQDFQLLELPYQNIGQGPGLSMIILLPKKDDGLPRVEEKLENYLQLPLDQKEVSVYLPKFKFESAFQLKESLQKLGMTDAFNPRQADFSGITGKQSLTISAVVHKAVVDVNEQGTKAAATTAVIEERGVSLVFRADHPFLFWIKDNSSGTLLFLGRVVEPQS